MINFVLNSQVQPIEDVIEQSTANTDRDEFLESSETAEIYRSRGASAEAAWDDDLPPPEEDESLEERFIDPESKDGQVFNMASKFVFDFRRGVGDYAERGDERTERNRQLIPFAKQRLEEGRREAENMTPEQISAHGLDYAGSLNYNLTSAGIDFARIDDLPIDVRLGIATLLEMYERLPNGTWKGTQRFFGNMVQDPMLAVGGVGGFKVVQKLLKLGGGKALASKLLQSAARSAGYGAYAAEGSAYGAMSEYMMQRLAHDPEKGEFKPDYAKIFTVAGIGAVAAPAIAAAPAVARGVKNVAPVVRDLFDTAGQSRSTLTSGVDPTPAITAALNYAGRKTRKSGQVVGAPPEITSQRALTKLRRNLEAAAREGEPGRFWYERSGQAILDALGGDRAEADKLAQAIAITSSATGVDTNFDFALQAYLQHKAGQPVRTGRFPANMSKRIQEVFDGKDWEGRKTNNFYVNLMRVIDPSKAQGVTTDMWMMRAFGFKNPDGTPYSGTPTDAQYTFVEQETKRIADQLGWEPQQVQAAIWVANKARAEGKDVADAAFDYSDALLNNKAQVSWESIPGRTGNHLPEMFDAPYEVQQEYHVAISKAFLDEDGNDFVAKELGLPTPGDFEAPGYFEGKVSPGTQTELAIPRQFKGPKYGQVEPAAYDLMKTYAAIRGIAMKQDGVGFHRPFYNPKLSDTNGVELRIGRKFSENETKQLANILSELSGHNEYNPIGARDGVRIINFDFLNYDNKEFVKLVQNAVDSVQLDDDLTIQQMYFASQNGYVGNDWSVNKNGEEYTTAISGKGRSDLQRKIRSILPRLQTRIDEVDADFSERYGFTRNNALNEQYRDEKITQAVPEPGIAPAAANEPIGIQPQQQE